MKHILFLLSFFTLSIFDNYAQDAPNVAANLLNVPSEFVKYNGQILSKIKYELIEEMTIDRTNVDTVNGRLVRRVDTTFRYLSTPVAENFGFYGLNLISAYLNSYGYKIVNDQELNKPGFWATAPVGEFAGQSFFYGASTVKINAVNDKYHFDVISYPFQTVEINGLPTSDHWMTIKQVTKLITGNVNINQSRLTVTKTNVRTNESKPLNVRVTKNDFEKRSKLSTDRIADLRKTTFVISKTNGSTHCNSMATDIVRNGIKYTGQVYFNGNDAKSIAYRNLLAPYGQKLNGYVTRFHLYNGQVNNVIFGSTFTKQMNENELSELNVVPGVAFNYNAATNTLTFDASKPAELRFQFELLPAQGKQPSWETRIDLLTGKPIY